MAQELTVSRQKRKRKARKDTLNLKNRASLANKATVSVTPKIMQLDL